MNSPGELGGSGVSRPTRGERHDLTKRDTPGPRGADAVRTLARFVAGRPLEACVGLFARYGDTVYLPVRPWKGLYIFSRPEQAEHVLAALLAGLASSIRGAPVDVIEVEDDAPPR